jgi:nucleotide-binding universal stress UspA family protein
LLLKKGGFNIMIPNIKKILYLTDLSDNSRKALVYAASLADAYGGAITVLHAFEIQSPNAALIVSAYLGYGSMDEFAKIREADILEEIKNRITETCDEIGCQFPACRFSVNQILIKTGRANDIILRHVKKGDFDIIVMGNKRGIKEVILGGMAQKVMRASRKPVVVVPLDRDV